MPQAIRALLPQAIRALLILPQPFGTGWVATELLKQVKFLSHRLAC
jgi:hypothetical protein